MEALPITAINRLGYIPAFDTENPEEWFLRLEHKFALHGVVNDVIKFWFVIIKLNDAEVKRIRNIVENPPIKDKYLLVKRTLLRYSANTSQRDDEDDQRRDATLSPSLTETIEENAERSSSNDMSPPRESIVIESMGHIFSRTEALRLEIVELREIIKESLKSQQGGASSVHQNTTTDENSTQVKVQNQGAVCWYHQKLGKLSTKCIQPCAFSTSKKSDSS